MAPFRRSARHRAAARRELQHGGRQAAAEARRRARLEMERFRYLHLR